MKDNKVTLNKDGFIEIIVVGDQTASSIVAMGEAIQTNSKLLIEQQKPVLLLDDIRQIGKVPPEGRKAVVALGKTLTYKKLAMLGKPGLIRFGANLLIRAMGQATKAKYFDQYDRAIAWLKK